ncbi:MAG: DUF3857 domain-containing protein [Chitinophagaceae bacterium]
MCRINLLLVHLVLLISVGTISGQESPPIKFGVISSKDFDLSNHHFDTSVSAVIIADVGISSFNGNSKGWFTLVHKRQTRVKILNRNGFDAADVAVVLFSKEGREERMDNLKAVTYNMEGDRVVETKLDNSTVFKEKISKNLVRKKFTLPAVKEGSIIEYSYTLSSDFLFNLQPWAFQGSYPCLWSECQVALPHFFNYVIIAQGYNPYFINKSTTSNETFRVDVPGVASANDHYVINSAITKHRWVMKEVSALKEESFTSAIGNHISKIEFQLSQYRFPNSPVKDIMGNWVSASEELMKDEEFGQAIEKDNNWLNDDIRAITANATGHLEKAKRIFAFIRDNFTCTNYSDVYLNNSLKVIFKNKSGSVADLNLLLVSMLRHQKIEVDPLLLSTRDHGFASEIYPLINRFNYVIAAAVIDQETYYLDASKPLGFGRLSADCYNGVGRIISSRPAAIYLEPDSIDEKKITSVVIVNNEKGQLEGSYHSQLGYMESIQLREQVTKKGEEAYFKKIRYASSDMNIEAGRIDSLKDFDAPLLVQYDFSLKNVDEDIIYFNPMIGEGYQDNLFKAAERFYPVEMPYTFNETFILNMEIPKNYTIDELPKSARVALNDGEGSFEFLVGKSGNTGIQVRSKIVLKKTNFSPEDYNSLREFFGYIVKKHSEQIVFKKKS